MVTDNKPQPVYLLVTHSISCPFVFDRESPTKGLGVAKRKDHIQQQRGKVEKDGRGIVPLLVTRSFGIQPLCF